MLEKSCQQGRAPQSEHPTDEYDTDAVAVYALLHLVRLPISIWEPACGKGNIANILRDRGHKVECTDITDRGCPGFWRYNFLTHRAIKKDRFEAIVTNPPYYADEAFVAIAKQHAPLVVMLLRLAFLEGTGRAYLLEPPRGELARVIVFSRRLPMMHRDGWTGKKAGSAVPFAWFVWQRGHVGLPTVERIDWKKVKP